MRLVLAGDNATPYSKVGDSKSSLHVPSDWYRKGRPGLLCTYLRASGGVPKRSGGVTRHVGPAAEATTVLYTYKCEAQYRYYFHGTLLTSIRLPSGSASSAPLAWKCSLLFHARASPSLGRLCLIMVRMPPAESPSDPRPTTLMTSLLHLPEIDQKPFPLLPPDPSD